ncbi:MAG: flagellar basal body L-ring protein FlgH [Rhodopirellula sp.]|nr:flagellar basal body L-ring protein FlgH [Rhodopirellula sp.]
MLTSRKIRMPVIVITCVLAGLGSIDQPSGNSAYAQTRSLTSQRNSTPVRTIQLRSRSDAQTESPISGPSRYSSPRATSSGSWPGLQTVAQQPQFVTTNEIAANGNQIQQTSGSDPYQLPPTGPLLLGTHRKRIRDYSWIYIAPPVPPEIKLHDIVTIIVDEKSEVIMNSKFNRQRRSILKADLKEFVRIGQTGNLTPAALDGPKIDAQLQGTLNSTGQLTDQEGIKYRIAATVVDVQPNGILQLEARKKIQTQDDVSEYTLTGELRASDVAPDNTASSENIANLNIVKNQGGRVYDATKRNWGYRLYDLLFPF